MERTRRGRGARQFFPNGTEVNIMDGHYVLFEFDYYVKVTLPDGYVGFVKAHHVWRFEDDRDGSGDRSRDRSRSRSPRQPRS